MNIPSDLTTSAWVDALEGLSRDDRIALLATFHRRVAHASAVAALCEMRRDYDDGLDERNEVVSACDEMLEKLVPPLDYVWT